MKKILIGALLLGAIHLQAQDTICVMFIKDRVIEFNYETSGIINDTNHNERFYEIEVGYREVLCLDFNDGISRVRKVITVDDSESFTEILDSESSVYYSPLGPLTVLVGKPRRIILK